LEATMTVKESAIVWEAEVTGARWVTGKYE
jgi:hypothetical protein